MIHRHIPEAHTSDIVRRVSVLLVVQLMVQSEFSE